LLKLETIAGGTSPGATFSLLSPQDRRKKHAADESSFVDLNIKTLSLTVKKIMPRLFCYFYSMRAFIAIVLLSFLSACKKDSYICVCTETQNRYGTQQYDLGNSGIDAARQQCEDYQAGLNKSGSEYQCRLD
jgi:hypothetical protein